MHFSASIRIYYILLSEDCEPGNTQAYSDSVCEVLATLISGQNIGPDLVFCRYHNHNDRSRIIRNFQAG